VVVVETVPIPEPKVGEARIKIIQGGICATDVELTRGYKGGALSHTLGHEFVARIDKLNIDAASQKPCHVAEGQRVVAEINCVADSCGCRDYHERAQHPERKAIGIFGADGAFAEYAIVPIVNIHPVPASVSDDEAMFVEPLAAACQISQQVRVFQMPQPLVSPSHRPSKKGGISALFRNVSALGQVKSSASRLGARHPFAWSRGWGILKTRAPARTCAALRPAPEPPAGGWTPRFSDLSSKRAPRRFLSRRSPPFLLGRGGGETRRWGILKTPPPETRKLSKELTKAQTATYRCICRQETGWQWWARGSWAFLLLRRW
jgi:hypothetical protein